MSLQQDLAPHSVSWSQDGFATLDTATESLNHQAEFKRVLDLAIAIPLVILLLPALLLAALAIRLETGGPVLFRQTRLGLHGKPFEIFKFRSMTVAENGSNIMQAKRGDARVTRVGSFLRASSIDELPQLLNVIAGDMSLVGPRPHPRAMDIEYAALIPAYNLRQSVKPGITGLAQVNGHRGATPTLDTMRARLDLDLAYARNASVALDLQIILRTPIEVARARNAY